MIVGASNAVNFTDGLDGLATVPVMIAAGAFGLIAYLVGNFVFADYLELHFVPGVGEVAVYLRGDGRLGPRASSGTTPRRPRSSWATAARWRSAARSGAVAVATKHEIVLAIVGGLFVVETVSVMIQVGLVQAHRQARLPHGADPPPLREAGLGGAHHRDPLLDRRGDAGAWLGLATLKLR